MGGGILNQLQAIIKMGYIPTDHHPCSQTWNKRENIQEPPPQLKKMIKRKQKQTKRQTETKTKVEVNSPHLFPGCKLWPTAGGPTASQWACRHGTWGKTPPAHSNLSTWTSCLEKKQTWNCVSVGLMSLQLYIIKGFLREKNKPIVAGTEIWHLACMAGILITGRYKSC